MPDSVRLARTGKLAHRVGHLTVEVVLGKVELLDAAEAREGCRDRAGELVPAGIDNGSLVEHTELVGEAAG